MPCALRTLDIWSIHNFTLYVSPTEVQRRLLAHIRKVWIGQISESQLFNIFLWIRKMRKNLLTWKYFRQFAIAARPFSDRVAYAESQFRFHLCSAALSVHAYKPAYFPICRFSWNAASRRLGEYRLRSEPPNWRMHIIYLFCRPSWYSSDKYFHLGRLRTTQR